MNVQVVHAPVHTAEQAREIIREAIAIANETDLGGEDWNVIFQAAVGLLGARASVPLVEQAPPMLLPRMDIPRGRR